MERKFGVYYLQGGEYKEAEQRYFSVVPAIHAATTLARLMGTRVTVETQDKPIVPLVVINGDLINEVE